MVPVPQRLVPQVGPPRTLVAHSSLSRRRMLAGLGALAGAALVAPRALMGATSGGPATPLWTKSLPRALVSSAPKHLVWVWQFRHDGDPVEVRDRLAAHGLGVVLKTHDGADWMSKYDTTDFGIYGPQAVADFARFFEDGGVPFHAWALVKGRKPEVEAQMAADVLSAGARSIFLDLEAHAGFWEGTAQAAGQFGELLRARQPNARISTSIDPRPWEIDRIPLTEFAGFSDEISPQAYWGFFNNNANAVKYRAAGSTVPTAGISPSFVVSTMMERLSEFGRPVHPIGDGTVTDVEGWREFIQQSYDTAGAETVSLWRYGVATDEMLALLRDTPPRVATYIVQPGDTLGGIASHLGTSISALAATNGITNPNLISVGQRLVVPSGVNAPTTPVNNTPTVPATSVPPPATGGTGGSSRTWPPAPAWSQPAASSGGGTYTVEPGDSLLGIALRHGTTLDRLMSANGVTNPNFIKIGQRLTLP